jgi:hypothetical protein
MRHAIEALTEKLAEVSATRTAAVILMRDHQMEVAADALRLREIDAMFAQYRDAIATLEGLTT